MNNISLEQMKERLSNIPYGKTFEFSRSFSDDKLLCEKEMHDFSNGGKARIESYDLYDGITLSFSDYLADETGCIHGSEDEILEINYCRSGRIGWKMTDKSTIYLGSGDFTVHTKGLCAGSVMTFPNGYYSGVTLCISLSHLTENPPELISDTGITGDFLRRKLCFDGGFTTVAGNEETGAIFGGFFGVPEEIRLPFFRLKVQELLFYLYRLDLSPQKQTVGYQPEQIEIIKQIHSKLTENLDKRITIEELSSQFPINPSSMKILFKAVYGNSIAAHIKEHRMEKAALLLRDSGGSISEIAGAVGYDSQSKFSSEFKKVYNMLPSEYRRLHR